ncbi:outer membrane protein transport protein [Nannocystis sp.]|uniref:OmpP1/FadL family transporter n=1 Tax=Nannocystis sp. TaxID=1962667 RepID=UPI0025D191D1|nr:outer membrane protein transport protein [Nannocystis sp.]MBK7828883.1 outer membrane protein transport protein [Nannocystis sp.]
MARPLRSRPRRAPLSALVRCAAILGLSGGVTAALSVSLDTTAHASGLSAARFGGEHGHPTTDNPTAIYYNPAGIALKPGTRIMLDANLAFRWASYQRPESAINNPGTGTPDDGTAANSGTAKLQNTLVSPFFGAHSDFGTKIFSAGAALYFPFGGQAVWGQNSAYANSSAYPGAHDGPQRWYTIDGKIRSMYITGAMAFNIPQIGLSIGVSGSAIRSETDTIRARNADGSDDLVIPPPIGSRKEGRSWLEASGWQGGFGIGAIWNWQQRLWIGASYTSQPNVVGGMTLKGKLSNALASPMVPTKSPAELTQTLPDIIRLGFRVRPTERVELRLFADYTRWSVFDKQCVLDASVKDRGCGFTGADKALTEPEGFGAEEKDPDGPDGPLKSPTNGTIQHLPRFWKDAGGVRAGASYWFLPQLETYVGAGYDSSAVRPQTLDAALMDMNKMSFSLGARWQIVKQFAMALTISDIAYFKVDTNKRSVLNKFAAPTKQASAEGIYKQNILLANLYLDVRF